jgi:hypothetical protein
MLLRASLKCVFASANLPIWKANKSSYLSPTYLLWPFLKYCLKSAYPHFGGIFNFGINTVKSFFEAGFLASANFLF